MALVGDVIQRSRRLIPDPCAVLSPLAQPTLAIVSGSPVLGAGNYVLQFTSINQWGETIPTNEQTITIPIGSNVIQATFVITPGITGINAYYNSSGVAGSENWYIPIPITPAQWGATVNIIINPQAPPTPGTPPSQNTAFNPDSNGNFASAATMFDWLNEALRELSRTCGGIRDYAGVQAINGQPMYVLPSNWIAITDIWYAGYWMQGGQRGNFFRANAIIAQILTSATVSVQDNRTILEVYPQPANSGGASTLTAPMSLTDTVVSVANPGFVSLAFGFVQVDSEIVAYAKTGTGVLTGLIRGLGGQVPATHLSGATITELNLVINGRRVFEGRYVPGNSMLVMPIPPGWSDILTDYVMYMARTAEQEYDKAETHLKNFGKKAAEWARSNSNAVKRRQIGPASVPEAYYGGVPGGGGWIIP